MAEDEFEKLRRMRRQALCAPPAPAPVKKDEKLEPAAGKLLGTITILDDDDDEFVKKDTKPKRKRGGGRSSAKDDSAELSAVEGVRREGARISRFLSAIQAPADAKAKPAKKKAKAEVLDDVDALLLPSEAEDSDHHEASPRPPPIQRNVKSAAFVARMDKVLTGELPHVDDDDEAVTSAINFGSSAAASTSGGSGGAAKKKAGSSKQQGSAPAEEKGGKLVDKISISVRFSGGGEPIDVHLRFNTKFSKLIIAVANNRGVPEDSISLRYEGATLAPNDTPSSVGMEEARDEDEAEIMDGTRIVARVQIDAAVKS